MPVTNIGPVVMTTAGDTYTQGVRIMSILWDGPTTSGDTALLVCPVTGAKLWPGSTDSSVTYLGVSFGPHGLPAPYGFKLSQISAATVYVYIKEQ